MDISAGASHACGVTDDGSAWCWGDNLYGQLGLGAEYDFLDRVPAPTHVDMPSGVAVAEITAGNGFTCALTTGGDIYCWGDDTYGQLGNGTGVEEPTERLSPVLVANPSIGAVNWVQVSAGNEHVCARTDTGRVFCWGTNSEWQLGLGDGFDGDFSIPMPIATTGAIPNTYAWVSAGSAHSCAIATGSTGTAWCWGSNYGGALGTGTASSGATFPVAVDMTAIASSGFTRIAAGGEFTCALESDGDAWCWGLEAAGELGNGGDAVETVLGPVAVTMPVDVAFEQIDIDYVNACARSTSDVVYCWGEDSRGGVGNTSNDGSEATWFSVPVAVDTSGDRPDTYVSVDTGDGFACAVTSGGQAWCWGANEYGELGNGDWSGSSETAPTRVLTPGTVALRDLAIGDGVACALDLLGRAWCWGENGMGQIGDGTRTDRLVPTAVTMPVVGGNPVVFSDIQMGGSHVCALDPSGAAWCWGENGSGQLGDGTTTDRLVPTPVDMPTDGSVDVQFMDMGLGANHTCAMAMLSYSYSKTWCWGAGSNGEIGDGNASNRSVPTEVTMPSYEGSPITAFDDITVGGSHACATAAPPGLGQWLMWCWGDNAFGQIGDGTTTDRPVPTPVMTPAAETIADQLMAPVAGGAHTCARNAVSTRIWCWGRGTSGQLGNGATGNSSLPVEVSLPETITSLYGLQVGSDFGCVLAYQESEVWCWGGGGLGQIGNGATGDVTGPTLVSLPEDIAWGSPFQPALAAGPTNMCLLTFGAVEGLQGGQPIDDVVCWGAASLWVSTSTAAVSTPTRLVPGTAPTAITAFGQLGLSVVGLLALGALTRSATTRSTRMRRRRRRSRGAGDNPSERGDW